MDHSPWQLMLKNGNNCLNNQQLDQAETFYLNAYFTLREARDNDPHSCELLMAWIRICHNLASLYEELGHLGLSLEYLTIPHEYLMQVTEANYLNHEIKHAAFEAISITLSAIFLFTKKKENCNRYCSEVSSLKKIMGRETCAIH